MGLGHYLFSFSGRVNRAKQWAIILVGIAWEVIVGVLFAGVVGFASLGDLFQEKITPAAYVEQPQFRTFIITFCVLYALMIYIALAVMTKRLHDRNKSAIWLLVFFVLPLVLSVPSIMNLPDVWHQMGEAIRAAQQHLPPPQPPQQSPLATLTSGAATIINLWAFVELFCLRGTVGDNRYGPDPLAGRA